MERCPVELWAKITSLACTDGGYTGYSLSLVSRTMRSIVKPVRYHSVSLIGNRKLLAFVDRLATMDTAPLIRHLFIADIDPNTHSYSLSDLEDGMHAVERWEELCRRTEGRIAQLNQAIHHVLASSAPHLYTLSVHGWSLDPTADMLVFPHLHDLVLLSSPPTWAAEGHACFPSLRRLHLLSAHTTPQFWSALADAAPHLTHLKLTNMIQDTRIAAFLRVLLDVQSHPFELDTGDFLELPPSRDEQALAAASRLSALEYVYVQPAAFGKSDGWCGNASFHHSEMVKELTGIAEAAERGECVGHFVLMSHLEYYTLDNAYRDWLEMADGSSRPWPEGEGGGAGSRPASIRQTWAKEGPGVASSKAARNTSSTRKKHRCGNFTTVWA